MDVEIAGAKQGARQRARQWVTQEGGKRRVRKGDMVIGVKCCGRGGVGGVE